VYNNRFTEKVGFVYGVHDCSVGSTLLLYRAICRRLALRPYSIVYLLWCSVG
jgi:hypothetical protein